MAIDIVYLITTWSRVLLEKLTGSHLVKKYFMEPEGSLPHSQVPATSSYPEPARFCPYPHFLKIRPNIILPSTPGSPKWSLSFRFPNQHPVYASALPICATCPAHLILLYPATTAWLVFRFRLEERPPIWRVAANILKKAVLDSWQGVVLQLGGWARCWHLTVRKYLLRNVYQDIIYSDLKYTVSCVTSFRWSVWQLQQHRSWKGQSVSAGTCVTSCQELPDLLRVFFYWAWRLAVLSKAGCPQIQAT